MSSLSIPAPAKINLFLHVIGRLDNGYHQLQTLFQLLDYGDTVLLKPRKDGVITIDSQLLGVSAEENIAVKAAKLLQEKYQVNSGVTIHIDKKLPMGGGLGGGSSNAASTLLGLNKLWGIDASIEQLTAIGLELGADVPVFVAGHTSLAEGIGEQLYPINIPSAWYVVIKPVVNVETTTIFSHPQLTRDTHAIRMAAFFEGEQNAALSALLSPSLQTSTDNGTYSYQNDCQKVVCSLYPEIAEAIQWLEQYSSPMLTGTGACIFARFNTEEEAQQVWAKIPKPMTGFAARSIQHSTAHYALQNSG